MAWYPARDWHPACLYVSKTWNRGQGGTEMEWLKSKTLIAGACLALLGFQGYGMISMRSTIEERVSSMEREFQSMHDEDSSKLAQFAADLNVVTKRMGLNAQELEQAHDVAAQ